MLAQHGRCFLFSVVVPLVWSVPLNRDGDRGPLAAVSDLNSAVSGLSSRVASRAGLLQGGTDRDPHIGLPTPQDLDTIKKVAQILVMLGEQVLPSIFGEHPSRPTCEAPPAQETSNDPVKE